MNLLDVAGSALRGAAAALPLASLAGTPAFSSTSPGGATLKGSSADVRDSAMAESLSVSSSVNALAQAATAQNSAGTASASTSSTDPLADLPPLPQLPTPQKAPATPTDDHGQSNIVFADGDSDGGLVH